MSLKPIQKTTLTMKRNRTKNSQKRKKNPKLTKNRKPLNYGAVFSMHLKNKS
jgi:hypothetical protein